MDPTCRSCGDYPCSCGGAIGVPFEDAANGGWAMRVGGGTDMRVVPYCMDCDQIGHADCMRQRPVAEQTRLREARAEVVREKHREAEERIRRIKEAEAQEKLGSGIV